MEDFYQQAQEYERDIIQHYVNKCKVMYSMILNVRFIYTINSL